MEKKILGKNFRIFSGSLLILILALTPVLQTSPTSFLQLPTASATGGIVLNNTATVGTVKSSPYEVILPNFNAGTGSNRVLIVGVSSDNQSVSSVTFGGTALTKKVSSFVNQDSEFWYLVNPSGTGSIIVKMSGATSVVVGAYAFSGVDQTSPLPTTSTNSGTSNPTISITTANANSLVLDLPSIWGAATLSSPTCTQQWDTSVRDLVHSKITGASSSTTKTLPGSVTCSWTGSPSSNGWDDVAVEVKAATLSTIALNNVATSGTPSSSSPYQVIIPSFNVGTGSNRLIVVGVDTHGTDAWVNSITFGSASLSKAVSSFQNNYASLWYLVNPSGTGNITVTLNARASVVVGAYAFSGVDQTNPIPTNATNFDTCSPSCTSPTVSITTQYANSWVVDSPSIWGGETLGSPTCTQQWNTSVQDGIVGGITGASSTTNTSSAGSVTCSWTPSPSSSDFWDDVAIEIKQAGGNTAPGAPTGLTASSVSSSQVNLSWTAPSNNGGSAITGYKIERSNDGGNTWTTVQSNTGNTSTTYSDTGLVSITTYTYRVSAINSVGTGSPSNTASATTQFSTSWKSSTGIIEPLYVYPYDSVNCPTPTYPNNFCWQPIINAHQSYPHVPFFVIVSPNSGPGSSIDVNYQYGIKNLTNSGVTVLGYVFTHWDNGSVTYKQARNWVNDWVNWYGPKNSTMGNLGIKGMNIDEMNTTATTGPTGTLSYYQNLTNYIHGNLTYSIGNPGTDTMPQFTTTVDRLNIYESNNSSNTCGLINKLDNATLQGYNVTSNNCSSGDENTGFPIDYWHTQYNNGNFSYIEYNQQSITKSAVQKTTPWEALLFITNATCACYDHIPPYLSSLAGYLNNTSVISTIQAKNTSGNAVSIPIQIYQSGHLVRSETTPFTYNETSGWQFNFTGSHVCNWIGSASSNTHSIVVAPTSSGVYTANYNTTC